MQSRTRTRTRTPGTVLGAALVALALVAGACGDDDRRSAGAGPVTTAGSAERTASTTAGEFPVTIETAAGEVEIRERPEAIVSLAPAPTEMLFAIGAGDQVEAVDDQSNHPPEAPRSDLSGYTPNLEAVAGYEPDLVVVTNDIGEIVAGLQKLGTPVLLLPAPSTIEGMYDQIEQLGRATGHAGEAAELVEEMRADVTRLRRQVPRTPEPLTYYHELDDTYYTVTSDTFVGQVYALAGLRNIADATADKAGGYPQLSSEFILEADPDLIFLADSKCCGQSAATVAARPGWGALTAVREGHVVVLDDDVASRWGPRVVDFLEAVVRAVTEAAGPA